MLVGRTPERTRIDSLLADAREGKSGALVLTGEAGVGKTALLDYAAEAAEGFEVLRAIGIQSEASLAFSGLMQLVRPALGSLDHVPEEQRGPLERALGLGQAGERELFLAYAGTLSLLAAEAEEQPLLCLVDDAHWLDTSSAEALGFVARRIGADRIAFLFAMRPDEGRGLDPRGIEQLDIHGLDERSAIELVAAGPHQVAPAVAHRLVKATGANPLALMEVPTLLTEEQRSGREPLDDPLTVGASVERAFLARASALSEDARRALLVAAASESGELDVIVPAAGDGSQAALDEAERAGLVHVRGAELGFRHPLVRSAVYSNATAGERRAAHAALAAAAGDPARRAWHLSEAAIGHDEEIAAALEQAATVAGRRCTEDEGRLLERAARLTPDPAERVPRLLRAGAALHEGGRGDEAMAVLDEGLSIVEDPLLRADLHEVRLYVARANGTVRANVQSSLAEADRVEALDPIRAANLVYHAAYHALERYDFDRSATLAARLQALAAAAGAEDRSLPALAHTAWHELIGGSSDDVRRVSVAGSEAVLAHDRLDEKAVDFAECLTFIEEHELAGRLLERAVPEYRGRASVVDLIRALAAVASLDLRLANVARASVAANEALLLSEEHALDYWVAWSLARLTTVEAVIGRGDEGRAHAARAVAICQETGDRETEAHAFAALGRLELGLGRAEEAAVALATAASIAGGVAHPGYILWRPDLVEAELRRGRREEAERITRELERRSSETAWTAAVAARCEALLSGADAAFEEALARSEPPVSSFERARTELVWGERLRRDGRRLDSREQLGSALAEFERLGAGSWAARAREELRASGQAVHRDRPHVLEKLTPRELEVALHAASGLTNREIGARLFLSPKTIELHLGRVYKKLGVRSRTELPGALPDRESGVREIPYMGAAR